jgi:hypothetical protein
MINVIKTFIIASLIADVLAVFFHCACGPITEPVQAALGGALLFSLLAACAINKSEYKEVVVIQ